MDSPERLADRIQSINISETQCYDGEGNFLGAFGTEMDVELETEQHFEGGVWVVKKRSITRVFSPEAKPAPLGLFPDS